MNKRIWLASVCALFAASCGQQASEPAKVVSEPEAAPAQADEPDAMETTEVINACAIIDSRNWHAWIDKMPSIDGGMRLHISGEVDMPTPGFTFEWVEGPADRAQPPGLRFKLNTTAPDGIVSQVLTTEMVKYVGETPYPAIRAIYVGCGDTQLTEIVDVTITE